MRELLLGDEAVAAAAVDAGIRARFLIRGRLATEIFESIEQRGDRRSPRWLRAGRPMRKSRTKKHWGCALWDTGRSFP